MKNLKDRNEEQKCLTCIRLERFSNNQNIENNYIDENGDEYIKSEVCYLSKTGKALSFDKKIYYTVRHDHSIKINNSNYNIKYLLAKTFKIEYYELLDNEENEYYVKFKNINKDDKSSNNINNYFIENLYVWSNSKKNWDNIPNSIEYYKKNPNKRVHNKNIFKDLERKENKDYREFIGRKFYKDGTFEISKDNYSKGSERKDNYIQTSIEYNGKRHSYKVHRIICFLFNPIEDFDEYNDYDHLTCNHINGNKTDNRYDNLEWITPSENVNHAIQTGLVTYCKPINLFKKLQDGNKGEFIKKCLTITEASVETKHSKDYIKKLATLKDKQKDKNKKTDFWFEFES